MEVYRKALSDAEDHSIVISCIGFTQNIALLLESDRDLIEKKVKAIVWMGGKYPPYGEDRRTSFNWDCAPWLYNNLNDYKNGGCIGAAEYAINNMPSSVEMIYSDLGGDISTGKIYGPPKVFQKQYSGDLSNA